MLIPPRTVLHRGAGLYAIERALHRRGFALVAGADEAGRGACAGPLVVAAVILPPGRRGEIADLDDSKLLSPPVRERVYHAVVAQATAYSVVIIPPGEIDRRGLHVCNVAGMRRALALLAARPEYVLTDGFRVDGLGVPGLAVWKGDQVAACVAAASVVAKVTRDRIMVELDGSWPDYGFAEHKGYVTPEHSAALRDHGPCGIHRFSYANVAAVADVVSGRGTVGTTSNGIECGTPCGGTASHGTTGVVDRLTVGVVHGGGRAVPTLVGENVGMEGGQG